MTRIDILQKLAAGEISVDEATRLLQEAAEAAPAEAQAHSAQAGEEKPKRDAQDAEPDAEPVAEKRKNGDSVKRTPRWLRIRVGRVGSERDHVRVNIPIGLVDAGLRLGAQFGDHKWSRTLSEMLDSIHRGEVDTLVEVEDDHSGERVRIFVD
ncbi:MAG: hypothetical protein IT323_02130 [Anaerolineae bacterium]|nr:hypothetical protein [Anaerolineae bacterium]